MKISDLSTDQGLDVLLSITPYVGNIAADDALLTELKTTIDPENAKTQGGMILEGMKKINALLPILLRDHRDDVYGVLAVLNGKAAEEVGKQSVMETAGQIREIAQDKALIDFFRSWSDGDKSK